MEGEPVFENRHHVLWPRAEYKSPIERHYLSNIDRNLRIGDCSVCGPKVKIKIRKTNNRCYTKYYQEQKEQRKRSRQNNPNVVFNEKNRQLRYYKKVKEEIKDKMPPCEACGIDTNICWDHEHDTGKFRGWLCRSCNSALGFAKDDPAILRALAKYIETEKNIDIRVKPGTGRKIPVPTIRKTLKMIERKNG